jgi:hypothetical protein
MPLGLVMTMKPVGDDEDEEEVDEEEDDDELLLEPVPLVPETVWPTEAATDATVPLTGAFSVVPSTACCAVFTAS